jgi:acyl-CoA thioesterase
MGARAAFGINALAAFGEFSVVEFAGAVVAVALAAGVGVWELGQALQSSTKRFVRGCKT